MINFLKKLEEKKPIPTSANATFSPVPDVKAMIFDIYGTLLISASGDIEEAEMKSKNVVRAFEEVGLEIDSDLPAETAGLVLTAFAREIKIQQKILCDTGTPYPEIDIKNVWRNVLEKMAANGLLPVVPGPGSIADIAFVFELLSNPVWPMPGMKEVIETLRRKSMPLGIVSNAQFYTPVCLNYFLSGEVEETESVTGFDDDLTVFSCQHKIGKPDVRLFEPLIEPLRKKYDLFPSQVMFVGNDMKKDVMAAKMAGFKTALFAGDMRSLRRREKDPEVAGIKPDFVVTELKQLLKIVA